MKGHSFSPLYWKSVHWALLDMVRQLGYPKIFWTISPYEWSMPYHEFVRDEMSKELRARLRLPVTETLHITHVLCQTVKGLVAGTTGKKGKDVWQRHLCQARDDDGQVLSCGWDSKMARARPQPKTIMGLARISMS